MKGKHIKSIYSRNLFSMLLIALTGILVFAFLFIPQFLDALRQKQEEQYRHRIQQTQESVDNLLETMNGLSLAIGKNQLLRPYLLRGDNTFGLLQASKELPKYTIAMPMIADLFFCVADSDKVIGRSGVWDRRDFGSSIYHYENLSQETLFQLLDAPGSGQLLSPDTIESYPGRIRTRVLPLVMPVPANSAAPYASLLVLLDEEMLLSELQKGWDQETVVLLNGATPLISTSELGEDSQLVLRDISAKVTAPELLEPSPNGELAYSRYPSRYSSLQYVVLVNRNSVFSETNTTVVRLLLWLFAGLWALACISYLLTRYNYRPIQSMLETAGVPVSRRMIGHVNENELVRGAIQKLNRNAMELAHVIRDSNVYVRESLVNRLLTAQYEEPQALREKCGNAGIDLHQPMFCPFFILPCGEYSSCGTELLAQGLEALPDSHCYLSSSLQKDCVAGILAFGKTQTDNPDLFGEFCRRAGELMGGAVCVLYGRPVEGPEEIAFSFAEIHGKLEPLRSLHTSGVLRFDDERLNTAPEDAPIQGLIRGVAEAVLHQSGSQLAGAMERLSEELTGEETTLVRARSIALEAGLLLAQELRRLELSHSLDAAQLNPFTDPWMNSREQLARTLHSMSCPLIRQYHEQSNQAKTVWFEDILLYIDEHLLEAEFSIYTVSDAFGMTVSAFSHMFKRNLNETFQSYTNRFKVQKAKRLLLETNLSLEEITDRLCYSSPSNFGRMFKSETKMTPSRFRRFYGTSPD